MRTNHHRSNRIAGERKQGRPRRTKHPYGFKFLFSILFVDIIGKGDRGFSFAGIFVSASSRKELRPSDRSLYYQRYPSYPPYCSDPIEMKTRSIPPLQSGEKTSQLVHVSAIVRHGARTPVHSKNCWKGHWDAPDGIWDCQLRTVLSTRPYYTGQTDEEDTGGFLVEKIYDAFQGDKFPSPYRNNMNGTCQDGQLIQQGYDQQVANGQYLRDAYVYNDETKVTPLGLFSTSFLKEESGHTFLEGILRYRSDDDQRTLASGQVLLSSMFQPVLSSWPEHPVIAHHTADQPNDILSSKKGKTHCPSQEALIEKAYRSDVYKAFFDSPESKTMRQLIENELEPEGVEFGGIDCLMTSICTDRSIPEVINDYGSSPEQDSPYTKQYGPNRFERLLNYVIENRTFASRFNDSELSKDDMGPFWAEIMDHIASVIGKKNPKKALKFALYSGHDSTILPLMASLGERVWNATDFPPYGSMMIIEIHKGPDFSSGYAFRLVYNGQVLTWLMDGCPEFLHLCDVSVLVDRVSIFATRSNMGCGIDEVLTTHDEPKSMTGFQFLVLSMLASCFLGSLLTFVAVRCYRGSPLRRQRDQSELISIGKDPTSMEFTDEPDIVID